MVELMSVRLKAEYRDPRNLDIRSFVADQPAMMKVLAAVETLALPDCWIGTGFVRNPVWDALHGRPWSASYTDVDLVYFDAADFDPEREPDRGRTTGCHP